MTERENLLMVLNGRQPKWVPYYRDAVEWVFPGFVMKHLATEEKIDWFSVPWNINDAGPIAKTGGNYVMDDANDWKKYVHLPELDSLDWETMAKQDLDMIHHDPNKSITCMIMVTIGGCFFIPLMNMMGFENGLCAMVEEPEAVSEMFEYLCEYQEKMIDYCAKYYNPDTMLIADDFCAAGGPMISFGLYEEMLRPLYKRLADRIHSYGKFLEFHMCGKGEKFVEDFVDYLGITTWQPAQPLNDLEMLKKKFGNRLVMNGAWLTSGKGGVPGASDDIIRESVRETIDNYAVGGGYIFWDGDPVGTSPDMLHKISIAKEEAETYGHAFYN